MSSGTAATRLSSRLLQETQRPTSAGPTDSSAPTVTNSSSPSTMPSFSEETSYIAEADFQHTLTVSEQRIMEEAEEYLYALIMENLTMSIGWGIGEPLIDSNCTVTQTQAAIGRYLQETDVITTPDDNNTYVESYVLLVSFRMIYTSRYGYDTTNYPGYLLDYINSHTDEVTEYLKSVINIGSSTYIVQSGLAYIFEGTNPPTLRPTDVPSSMPSDVPSDVPSLAPSLAPSYYIPPSGMATGSVVGIAIGSFLGALMIFVGLNKALQRKREVEEIEMAKVDLHENGNNGNFPDGFDDNGSYSNMCVAVPVPETDREKPDVAPPEEAFPEKVQSPEQINHVRMSSLHSNVSSQSEGGDSFSMRASGSASRDQTHVTVPTSPASTDYSLSTSRSKQTSDVGTFMGTNLLMRDDSFSSDSNDEALMQHRDMDEFEQYKNEALEQLREEVEKTIYDVDSMMSLAMTRIFMEADGTFLDLSWVGAEDPASIEASCYFEAFDWMKQNTVSSTS